MKPAYLFVILLMTFALFVACSQKIDTASPAQAPPAENKEPAQVPAVTGQVVAQELCKKTDKGVEGTLANGTSFSKENKCFGGLFLVSYYCDNGEVMNTNTRCENGCKKAACLQ